MPGPVRVRKYKRKRPSATKRTVAPKVKIPGMGTNLIVEGDTINVKRTPTTINVHKLPTKPKVIRKK